jgi:hypothetical protein
MIDSKEKVTKALDHKTPKGLPVDFGGTLSTGIHVSMVYKIRQELGLDRPFVPVKIIEPFQMLGEIKHDLKSIIGVDTEIILSNKNFFGFENDGWREWKLWDGTPVLVPKLFNTKTSEDGSVYLYPQGDENVQPSGKMPAKGYYFDVLIRQEKIDDNNLNPVDNTEEYKIFSKIELDYIQEKTDFLYNNTDYALIGQIVPSGCGDIAQVPGPMLKFPKGIRDVNEWYISIHKRKEYLKKVFEIQSNFALKNYEKLFKIVGNKLTAVFVSGTDFGMQSGLMLSIETYRELYKPYHLKINNWIHKNTQWKSFMHSCGSVYELIPDFIEAGFDILNPIQISAKDMEPEILKKEFGKYITFWGGGIDTQKTLPYGTKREVEEEMKRNIDIFNKDGGFVFSTVHNIQANVPVDNVLTMIKVLQDYRKN